MPSGPQIDRVHSFCLLSLLCLLHRRSCIAPCLLLKDFAGRLRRSPAANSGLWPLNISRVCAGTASSKCICTAITGSPSIFVGRPKGRTRRHEIGDPAGMRFENDVLDAAGRGTILPRPAATRNRHLQALIRRAGRGERNSASIPTPRASGMFTFTKVQVPIGHLQREGIQQQMTI